MIEKNELKKKLELHRKYLNNEKYGIIADLRGANLRDANFIDANLRGADLRGANLRGANLIDANLRDTDLRDANLIDANLRGADLRGANLRGVDLRGADLRGAKYRDIEIKIMKQYEIKYKIYFIGKYIKIGCKEFEKSEWLNFEDSRIRQMDIRALGWWNDYKEFIFNEYDKYINEIKEL